MYSLTGFTNSFNYYYIYLLFIISNIISIIDFFFRYRKEALYPEDRYLTINGNFLSYLSKKNINILYFILIISNILSLFGYFYRVNLLFNYLYYYVLNDFSFITHAYHRILSYTVFIFLISPSCFENKIIPSYGLFFLNYKLIHIYISAGLHKIKTEEWLTGISLRFTLTSNFSTFPCTFLIPHNISEMLCYITLYWEIFGWYIIINNYYGIILGLIFHTGLLIFMFPTVIFQIVMFFIVLSYYEYLPEYNENLYLSFSISIFLYIFLLIQVLNDFLPENSSLRSQTIIKILNFFNINQNSCYQLFGNCYPIINSKSKIIIINNKGIDKEIFLKTDNTTDFKYLQVLNKEYDNIEKLNKINFNHFLRESLVKKFKKNDTSIIKFQCKYEYLSYDFIVRNPYLFGMINNILINNEDMIVQVTEEKILY